MSQCDSLTIREAEKARLMEKKNTPHTKKRIISKITGHTGTAL